MPPKKRVVGPLGDSVSSSSATPSVVASEARVTPYQKFILKHIHLLSVPGSTISGKPEIGPAAAADTTGYFKNKSRPKFLSAPRGSSFKQPRSKQSNRAAFIAGLKAASRNQSSFKFGFKRRY